MKAVVNYNKGYTKNKARIYDSNKAAFEFLTLFGDIQVYQIFVKKWTKVEKIACRLNLPLLRFIICHL